MDEDTVGKLKPKEKPFYVNTNEFSKEIRQFYETGVWTPFLTDAIQKIAKGTAFRHNFIHYSWREDMVSMATFNMVTALSKKLYKIDSKFTAFGYFSVIAYNACVEIIKKEDKNRKTIRSYKEQVYKELLNDCMGDENSIYVKESLEDIQREIDLENDKKEKNRVKDFYKKDKFKKKQVSTEDDPISQL